MDCWRIRIRASERGRPAAWWISSDCVRRMRLTRVLSSGYVFLEKACADRILTAFQGHLHAHHHVYLARLVRSLECLQFAAHVCPAVPGAGQEHRSLNRYSWLGDAHSATVYVLLRHSLRILQNVDWRADWEECGVPYDGRPGHSGR